VFTLTILATSATIDAVKAELLKTLPDVKSSHRCEAIARGLNFRTYASLLTAVRSTSPVVATAHGVAFSTYLQAHGFDVSPQPFYRAVVRVAIRAVLESTPKLTASGIGVGEPRRKPDGKWENWRDQQVKFVKDREELLSDYAVEPFLLSLALLKKVEPTKTIRPSPSSYWIKRIAENYACTYPEGNKLGPQYVTNGIFIAAAIHAGFKIKTYMDERGFDSLNVSFNMSKPILIDLDCEIRPDGARAQDRRRRDEWRRNKALHIFPA